MIRLASIAFVMSLMFVVGCGGGGGDHARHYSIYGQADLSNNTAHPLAAIMTLDINNNWVVVSSYKISRGEGNRSFRVVCPEVYGDSVYVVWVFDDKNSNGRYDQDTDVFLGEYDYLLAYNQPVDRWQYIYDNGDIYRNDATDYEIYIYAYDGGAYRTSAVTVEKSPAERKAEYKSMLVKKQGPVSPM